MSNMDNKETLRSIQELVERKLTLLESQNSSTNMSAIVLPIKNYRQVMDLVLDLLKTAIMALRVDYEPDRHIGEPETNILGVLELIIHILPYEEMGFLDELKQLAKE